MGTFEDVSEALSKNVISINVATVEAWKLVNEAISHPTYGSGDTDYRRDFQILTKVSYLINNSSILVTNQNNINVKKTRIKDMIILATSNKLSAGSNNLSLGLRCNTCQNTTKDQVINSLPNMLEDVKELYNKYQNVNGVVPFNGANLTQLGVFTMAEDFFNLNSYPSFQGVTFLTRVLVKTAQPSVVKGFEVNYVGASGSPRRGDVVCNTTTRDIIIDGKSWTEATLRINFKVGQQSYNQFLDYIGLISNLNQLEYWFDERKINPTTFEYTVQNIWLQNNSLTAEGNALFNAIWANDRPSPTEPNGLRGSLFPNLSQAGARTEFATMINTLDNRLFGFIKVK